MGRGSRSPREGMEDGMSDLESTIAQYRHAGIAGADLAEIEDHLRALVADLRESGMPAALAVTEAARRLGEPTALAREHARVRSPFGAKLSRARAWSAAALLVCTTAWNLWWRFESGRSLVTVDLALSVLVLGALIARLAWARPLILGGLVFTLLSCVAWYVFVLPWGPSFVTWISILEMTTVLVLLMPWRRGELTLAAIGLGLLVTPFYAAASLSSYAAYDGAHLATWTMVPVVIGGCGIVLRARWSALAVALSTVPLVVALLELGTWSFPGRRLDSEPFMHGVLLAGIACAIAAAVIAWRTARSTLGRLDAVLT